MNKFVDMNMLAVIQQNKQTEFYMMSKIKKEQKELKISAGLLVGYVLAGTINMLAFNKTWNEAFSEKELIFGFVGIAISIFIILRLKRK